MIKQHPSRLVGFFCDNPLVGSGFFGMLQMGMLTACRKDQCELLIKVVDTHAPDMPKQVQAVLERTPLLGVVLTQPLCDMQDILDVCFAAGLSVVRIAPRFEVRTAFDISIDNRRAAYDMTSYLIGLGHKRIAFVNGPPDHGDAKERFAGYCKAMEDAGLPIVEELCVRGSFEFASGVAAGEQLLNIKPPPSAIFACNDEMAVGVLAAADRLNLRIPEDLSLAGFDDSPIARMVRPELTTCRQRMELMGYQAAEFLINPPGAPEARKQLLQHELIVRQSTAQARG